MSNIGKSSTSPSHSYNTRSASGKSPNNNVCYVFDDYDSSSEEDDEDWLTDHEDQVQTDDVSATSEVTLELDSMRLAQLHQFPSSPPKFNEKIRESKRQTNRHANAKKKNDHYVSCDEEDNTIEGDLCKIREHTEKDQLREMLTSSIIQSKPNIAWDDIIGLDIAKSILKKTVILPTRFPSIFTGKRQPFKAILLYGPPGTGKTLCAKAVATELEGCTFYNVSSSDLMSKWAGESEKLVKTLFEMAQGHEGEKVVIFFDEIDSLVVDRDGKFDIFLLFPAKSYHLLSFKQAESDAATRKLLSELLICMDGVEKLDNKVLVLGATNRPWALDPAIRRRFEKRVYIPLPTQLDRCRIIRLHLDDIGHDLSDENFHELGSLTEGYSASDLDVLVRDVLLQPINRCEKASYFVPVKGSAHFKPLPTTWKCPLDCFKNDEILDSDEIKPNVACQSCGCKKMTLWDIPKNKLFVDDITFSDFLQVLGRRSCSTVSPEELRRYDEWTDRFGEKGSN